MRMWLLAFLLLGITTALAQDITGGLNNTTQTVIGGAGSGGGLNNSTGKIVGGGGGAPTCSGTIDLSNGCPQPMLGVS